MPLNIKKQIYIVYALTIIFLYEIYGYRQLQAQPWQWADDGLYATQANGILDWLSGKSNYWLGEYKNLVLTKEPLFPIFIVLCNIVNIPIHLAEFLLILLLTFFFKKSLSPILKISPLEFSLITFLIVAIPSLPGETRLIRSSLNHFCVGSCLISCIGLVSRFNSKIYELVKWSLLIGVTFSMCHLNREEGSWLSIPIIISTLSVIILNIKDLHKCSLIIVLILTSYFIPLGIISFLNWKSYGVFITSERHSPDITKTIRTLYRIEPEHQENFVPISTSTRLHLYLLSPTFAKLAPYLEGPLGDEFARNKDHLALNEKSPNQREFFVSNFEFALYRACFYTGIDNAVDMQDFFKKLGNELNKSISNDELTVNKYLPYFFRTPSLSTVRSLFYNILTSLKRIIFIELIYYNVSPVSSGEPNSLLSVSHLTHNELTNVKDIESSENYKFNFRPLIFGIIIYLQRFIYLTSFIFLHIYLVLVLCKENKTYYDIKTFFISVVLLLSLYTWSTIMAILSQFGFPHLKYPTGYNSLGFIIICLVSAFVVTLVKNITLKKC
jgi:hypothetical protein